MISTHAEKAAELFKAGYNCSQSVAAAFCDVTKTDEKTMLATAAPFGGGFGRNREVCGAISGGCLVLGLLYGYTDPSDKTAKSEHYALVRDFMARFSVRFGSVICRELLGGATAVTENEVLFFGDIRRRKDCKDICDFISKHGKKAVYIPDIPLYDYGSPVIAD